MATETAQTQGASGGDGGDAKRERRENLLVPDIEPWPVDAKEPVISLEGVTKRFEGEVVLDDLTLSVPTGEITVVIGASGSGKSVLIKHMNGLYTPDEGTVKLFGKSVREMGGGELNRVRQRIGTLFQNYALFDSMTVVENVAFPLIENGNVGREEAREHAAELLTTFDLGNALGKRPAELSGGMKKRVSLARALVGNPEVVLFDEPTTGLDPILMEFVDEMILETTEKFLLTSVIISHDMASTFRLADRIAVLHEGTIIEVGRPAEIRRSTDERVQSLIRGATKNDIAIETASDVDVSEGEAAVEIREVSKSFSGETVLDGVSMRVPVGKITALIGGSGAGKSVMMKHILKLMTPDSGTVEVFGQDLAALNESEMRELRTKIGMLFQHAALFDSMTVGENVAFPLIERQVCSRAEANERVDEMLERLSIAEIKHEYPPRISSGQQKRASLARALITEPPLVIYDEPTTGQDPMMTRQVEEMIREVQDNFDVTSLVISHDMALTFRLADHVALLAEGEILAEGPPAKLLESQREEVRRFVFASEVAGADEFDEDEVPAE